MPGKGFFSLSLIPMGLKDFFQQRLSICDVCILSRIFDPTPKSKLPFPIPPPQQKHTLVYMGERETFFSVRTLWTEKVEKHKRMVVIAFMNSKISDVWIGRTIPPCLNPSPHPKCKRRKSSTPHQKFGSVLLSKRVQGFGFKKIRVLSVRFGHCSQISLVIIFVYLKRGRVMESWTSLREMRVEKGPKNWTSFMDVLLSPFPSGTVWPVYVVKSIYLCTCESINDFLKINFVFKFTSCVCRF